MIQKAIANLSFEAELRITVHRVDGSHRDLGVVAGSKVDIPKWRKLYWQFRRGGHLPLAMTFAAFLSYALRGDPMMPWLVGVVTTAGVNKITTLPQALIMSFNYHSSGTGSNAEAIGDTALQTPTGIAVVSGTQSNPSANIYRSVATVTYDGGYNITEWGLFDVSNVLWDRRRFAAYPVILNDGLIFDYRLTVIPGG